MRTLRGGPSSSVVREEQGNSKGTQHLLSDRDRYQVDLQFQSSLVTHTNPSISALIVPGKELHNFYFQFLSNATISSTVVVLVGRSKP